MNLDLILRISISIVIYVIFWLYMIHNSAHIKNNIGAYSICIYFGIAASIISFCSGTFLANYLYNSDIYKSIEGVQYGLKSIEFIVLENTIIISIEELIIIILALIAYKILKHKIINCNLYIVCLIVAMTMGLPEQVFVKSNFAIMNTILLFIMHALITGLVGIFQKKNILLGIILAVTFHVLNDLMTDLIANQELINQLSDNTEFDITIIAYYALKVIIIFASIIFAYEYISKNIFLSTTQNND